jgi:VWFA-related protein
LQAITAFESMETGFDCAILLDQTGSMEAAMPALKGAVLRLIDAFRGQDRFAVYAFNYSLRRIHDYSRDRTAAKLAVRSILPGGGTALFDSLNALAADLGVQKGKKAIIAFTDGMDNSSYLHAKAAMTRAKTYGLPIYAVAQGEALRDPQLFRMLKEITQVTGGEAYAVSKPSQISRVFAAISDDVQHAYLLTYVAPPAVNDRWRTIQVVVKGVKTAQVRAREGYFPR